jgi:hypothetical protein
MMQLPRSAKNLIKIYTIKVSFISWCPAKFLFCSL